MAYVIAAYHDLGMLYGREHHEIVSGEILKNDTTLKKWFDKFEIETMCLAVQEHRSSYEKEPQSIYGKIVSQADRNFEIDRILFRAIEYGKKYYSEYDFEQQFERVYNYLKSKYGTDGYIKLWLSFDEDEKKLVNTRKVINDVVRMRELCHKYYIQ